MISRVIKKSLPSATPYLVFFVTIISIFCIAAPHTAHAFVIQLEVGIGTLKNVTDPYLSTYMGAIYRFLIGMIAIAAVSMISFGGLQWALAAGNQEQVTAAKKRVVDALIGLVLALLSYNILSLMNPQMTVMKDIDVPDLAFAAGPAEVNCQWMEAAGAASTNYISSRDTFCEDKGDKPSTTAACYCDLRSNIVSMAQVFAADYNSISYGCCWGFCDVVYNEAGASFSGSHSYKSSIIQTMTGKINGSGTGCTPGDNSVANTSACTDGLMNYANLLPGDWLYIFNGHSAGLGGDGVYNAGDSGNGLHSVIFLSWTDEANHVGTCASGGVTSSGAQYASVHVCDFEKTPITHQYAPVPATSYKATAGKCG